MKITVDNISEMFEGNKRIVNWWFDNSYYWCSYFNTS
ncbi:Uncharacterised protein [Citrobacter koseri]|nr:Uncharacterised protein [Citrobacter koseri]